jgi:hypothetical protein
VGSNLAVCVSTSPDSNCPDLAGRPVTLYLDIVRDDELRARIARSARSKGESAMAEFSEQLRRFWARLAAWLNGGQRAETTRKAKAALEDLRDSDAARRAEAALRDLRQGEVGRKAEAAIRDLREGETGRKAREALRDLRDSDAGRRAREALRDLRDSDAGRKATAAIRDLRDHEETGDKS